MLLTQKTANVVLHDYEFKPFVNHDKPLLYLCSGGPGTGKTFTINFLDKLSQLQPRIQIVKACFMGTAAIQARGMTLHNLLGLGIDNGHKMGEPIPKLDDIITLYNLRKNFKLNGFDKRTLPIIILDEISMVTPTLLACLHVYLTQLTGVDAPFGGIPVLLFGDFNQIEPVGNKNNGLADAAVQLVEKDYNRIRHLRNQPAQNPTTTTRRGRLKKIRKNTDKTGKFAPNASYRLGATLFSEATWLPLIEQQRSHDPKHTEFVNHMFHRQRLHPSLFQTYKELSTRDLQNPDSPWHFAPFIVTTNRDRVDICSEQATKFAKHNNTVKIRWPVNRRKWVSRPSTMQQRNEAIQNDPCFWQEFVVGAPIYITTNIKVDRKLANGTQARLHSLLLSSETDQIELDRAISAAKPGSTITLPNPPKQVIVELFYTPESQDIKNEWIAQGNKSLCDRKILVPLNTNKKPKQQNFYIKAGSTYYSSKVTVQPVFPYEIGFAMTVHKSQGRTLSQVIICLGKRADEIRHLCQLTYSQLFVAMSRVKSSNDIRFFFPAHQSRKIAIDAMCSLLPPKNIIHYFNGFVAPLSKWNPDLVYQSLLNNT